MQKRMYSKKNLNHAVIGLLIVVFFTMVCVTTMPRTILVRTEGKTILDTSIPQNAYTNYDPEIALQSGGALAINGSGCIYICDSKNDSIRVYTPNGTFLFKWGSPGSGNGQFNYPCTIGINATGHVYVGDGLNCRIQVFSPSGEYLFQWGSSGTGTSQFYEKMRLAVNSSGYVYVGDRRVQVFTPNGQYLFSWGSINGVAGMAFNDSGYLIMGEGYCVPDCGPRITVWTPTGTLIRTFGSNGLADGKFDQMCAVATNSTGHVFAGDHSGTSRLSIFTSTGEYMKKIEPCPQPLGIGIDASGAIYIAQYSEETTWGGRVYVYSSDASSVLFEFGFLNQTFNNNDSNNNNNNTNLSLPQWVGPLLGVGLLALIVFIVVILVRQRNLSKAISEKPKIIRHATLSPEEQMKKLQNLFSITTRMNLENVGDIVGLSRKDLMTVLVENASILKGIKIDGDFITVQDSEDLNSFIQVLDQQFNEWEHKETTKEGKKS